MGDATTDAGFDVLDEYFKTRLQFEDLSGKTESELRQRLDYTQEQIDGCTILNGSVDPILLTMVRHDLTSLQQQLYRLSHPEYGRTAEPEHLTDLGNARRLVALFGENIRYSNQHGWFVWEGRRWQRDNSGAVERFAKSTIRALYNEAAACDDKDLREKIAAHAHKSEADARIKAMLSLAKTEAEIVVAHDQLDRDPWLFNVKNGTLDLRTGELKPHNREDLITRLSPVDYDPKATCPAWLNFLEQIMDGNADVIRFLRKAAGYSLTGSTREQCLFMLYGTGANGKSTFLNILSTILADYGCHTRMETLLAKRGDQIPNDVARLAGARFVSAVEVEDGRRLAEGLVKQMTGGDRMSARFLHCEFFEFEPAFKIWLSFNHKPRIRGTDQAIWRRIRLIPFSVTIPEDDRDPDLLEKLKPELTGILRWAVDGCQMWMEHGLKTPDAVRAATNEYREESDVLGAFIAERCELGPDSEIAKGELYEAYREWCGKSGEYAVSKKQLGALLLEKGFSEDRSNGARFWTGIAVKP